MRLPKGRHQATLHQHQVNLRQSHPIQISSFEEQLEHTEVADNTEVVDNTVVEEAADSKVAGNEEVLVEHTDAEKRPDYKSGTAASGQHCTGAADHETAALGMEVARLTLEVSGIEASFQA